MKEVLEDSLHYPECVVKFEVFRVSFQEKVINDDVDKFWKRLEREEPVVVKSAHSMLTRMAWGLSDTQLKKFFEHIQVKWRGR